MTLKIKSAIKVSGVFVMGFPTVYRDYIKNDLRCRNVLFRSSNLRIPLGVSTKELFQTYLP